MGTLFPFSAIASSTLEGISVSDKQERVHILLRFSTLPKYSTSRVARRINLIFNQTISSDELTLPPSGDKVIKSLKTQQENKLELSFFLRYNPQNVNVSAKDENTIVVDVLVGNPYSQQYPDLADQLLGVTLLDRNKVDYTNPLQTSQYANNWIDFFKKFETKVSILPSINYTLPDFPIVSSISPNDKEDWLPKNIAEAASYKKWNIVETMIQATIEHEDIKEQKQRLILTYCEALIRKGEYEIPLKTLEKFKHTYKNSPLNSLVNLLTIYLQIRNEDPYLGLIKLKKFEQTFPETSDLSPYLNILLAETAMHTGKPNEANSFLQRDNVAYKKSIQLTRNIREADLLYLDNKNISALVSYMATLKQGKNLYNKPRSLSFFGDVLYMHNRWSDAESSYSKLSELITDKKHQDLALFRLASSRLKQGKDIYPLLNQIQYSFPKSEGAHRARLKLADLDYISRKTTATQIIKQYRTLSQVANRKPLREEATFKMALVQALENDSLQSVYTTVELLRNFKNGTLQSEAMALLVQQLPEAIRYLVNNEEYIEALVLAKKNRELFKKGWLDNNLLYDLAEAYEQIGASMRSATAYEYILETTNKEFQKPAYLPLITILYKNGDFEQAEKYAKKYFSSYIAGENSTSIFLLRVKALNDSEKTTQAAKLLKNSRLKKSDELDVVSAQVFFNLEQYKNVIKILGSSESQKLVSSNNQLLFFLAESYFQTQEYIEAEKFFNQLQDVKLYSDQAFFRTGQILLLTNKKKLALKRFKELTEKGTSPLWKKLAKEQVQINSLRVNR